MNRMSMAMAFGMLAGCGAVVSVSAQAGSSSSGQDDKSKTVITGCVAAGAEAGHYTLTNPSMNGTAMTPATGDASKDPSLNPTPWYALEGGDLKPHFGHKIEVTGTLTDARKDTGAMAAASKAAGTLNVTSVKMLASSCP